MLLGIANVPIDLPLENGNDLLNRFLSRKGDDLDLVHGVNLARASREAAGNDELARDDEEGHVHEIDRFLCVVEVEWAPFLQHQWGS